jgi:hypothetical protein
MRRVEKGRIPNRHPEETSRRNQTGRSRLHWQAPSSISGRDKCPEERTRICESSFQRTLHHRSQHSAVTGLCRRKNQHFRLKSLHPPAVCNELETTARPHVALQQELAVANNIFIRRHFQLIPFQPPETKGAALDQKQADELSMQPSNGATS